MLNPEIIELIRKNQEKQRVQQPVLQIPLPEPELIQPNSKVDKQEEKTASGVIVIDIA